MGVLTRNGYRIEKRTTANLGDLCKRLHAKPVVPKVFNPWGVKPYKVYDESESYLYLPKHVGIDQFGPPTEILCAAESGDSQFWEFAGGLRPAQYEVVNAYLQPTPHDGLLCLHTGGGKTVCALYIASQLKVKTLILVHNTFLRDQWVDRIKAFLPKARIGILNDDETNDILIKDFVIRECPGGELKYKTGTDTPFFKLIKNAKPDELTQLAQLLGTEETVAAITAKLPEYMKTRDITIAMLQRVAMTTLPKEVFFGIGLTIIDECHHIASEVFVRAFPKVTSQHMLGLSATPERKDGLMHVINWFLGPILYRSDTGDKVDTDVRVEVYQYTHDDPEFNKIIYNSSGVMFTTLMINKLAEFADRTKYLSEIIAGVMEECSGQRQMLVLTDRVDHCTSILEALPDTWKSHAAILGRDVKSSQRTEWCASKKILIATYSMCKEGFDVPTLNTLLIATPRPDVDQIVGRILRVEKAQRTIHPLILDVVDTAFRRQFQERLSLYKKRQYTVETMKLV